jgi:type IV pilus assembly protein PilC
MGKAGKLAMVYHNLSVTLEAGVSIIRAFTIVSEGLRGRLQKVFLGIRDSISKGESLSDSMKLYHRTFDEMDLLLAEAAETSGKFPECFKLLAKWYEFKIKIFRIIMSGLIFPLVILHIALFIVPVPTLVTNQHFTLNNYLWMVFRSFAIIYFSVFMLVFLCKSFRKSKVLKEIFDTIILYVPVLGKAVWELSISKFAFAFGMMYKAGVPIVQSLPMAVGLTGNSSVSKIFAGGAKSVQEGNAAIEGFSKRMPSEYRNLWQVGEETGELTKTVDKIAEISSDRAELYFTAFAKGFPRLVYFAICIWMAYYIITFYSNLYQIPEF